MNVRFPFPFLPLLLLFQDEMKLKCSLVPQWNTLRLELFAIAPISASTEISIEYLPNLITFTHSERQSALKNSFGFSQCLCKVCTAPLEERKVSDARRREIRYLVGGLKGGVRDRKKTMETMGKIHELCQAEGLNGLPDFGAPSSLFPINSADFVLFLQAIPA